MFSDELLPCPGKSYGLQFCLQAMIIIIDIKMIQDISVLEHPHSFVLILFIHSFLGRNSEEIYREDKTE